MMRTLAKLRHGSLHAVDERAQRHTHGEARRTRTWHRLTKGLLGSSGIILVVALEYMSRKGTWTEEEQHKFCGASISSLPNGLREDNCMKSKLLGTCDWSTDHCQHNISLTCE